MSKGRLSSRWIGLAIIVIAACAGGAAYAGMGQPSPWEMKLQDSATPVMDNIIWFHNFLLWLITGITLFVLALLVIVVVRFNAKTNPVPSKTTHHTLIEVAWTIIPVLILVGDRGAVVPAAVSAARRAEGRSHHQGHRRAVELELSPIPTTRSTSPRSC